MASLLRDEGAFYARTRQSAGLPLCDNTSLVCWDTDGGFTLQWQDVRPTRHGRSSPNIILLLADDSGFGDIHADDIDTPHLRGLAKNGLVLSSFYTNGRCSPSRASLLTGIDSSFVGFGAGVLAAPHPTLPRAAYQGRLPYTTPTIAELLQGKKIPCEGSRGYVL